MVKAVAIGGWVLGNDNWIAVAIADLSETWMAAALGLEIEPTEYTMLGKPLQDQIRTMRDVNRHHR